MSTYSRAGTSLSGILAGGPVSAGLQAPTPPLGITSKPVPIYGPIVGGMVQHDTGSAQIGVMGLSNLTFGVTLGVRFK